MCDAVRGLRNPDRQTSNLLYGLTIWQDQAPVDRVLINWLLLHFKQDSQMDYVNRSHARP